MSETQNAESARDALPEEEIKEFCQEQEALEVASELPSFERLTSKAIENLERNARLRKEHLPVFKLEPGEKALLVFEPENIGSVGIENLYTVIDPRTTHRWIFLVPPYTSEDIDSHLRRGNIILRVQRVGTHELPEYSVTPVYMGKR